MDNDNNTPAGKEQETSPRGEYFAPKLELSDSTREVFEKYSKIPPNEVLPHVYAIREKAWSIHPYPCIGLGRFLHMGIGTHRLYHTEILPRMLTGEQSYLDLGCAFAQDIRRLVADGVDSKMCYASDLQLDFLDLGYELFRDRESLRSRFIAADVFDAGSPLMELEGKIDIVDASSFFHLFAWEDQKRIARIVVKLLRAREHSLVVGRQIGNQEAGDYGQRDGQGTRYWHNAESWKKMWKEIGEEVGVKFEVEVVTRSMAEELGRAMQRPEDEKGLGMEFSVRRLS